VLACQCAEPFGSDSDILTGAPQWTPPPYVLSSWMRSLSTSERERVASGGHQVGLQRGWLDRERGKGFIDISDTVHGVC